MIRTGFLISAILAATFVQSQNQVPRPTFDVAAIRSASPPTPQTVQSGQFRTGSKISGSNVDFEFVTLADLIPYAYRVKSFQAAGPDWMRQLRWNILAKLPDGASRDQAPEMMQALLEDRFKLTLHHEKRQQPVYELVALKGGPKLTPAENTAEDDSGNVDIGLGAGGFFPPGPGPGGAPPPDGGGRGGGRGAIIAGGGARISQGENCGIRIEFDKMTMQGLADTLTPFLDRPVIDSTATKGAFKIAMDLPMDAMFAMMQNTMRNSGFAPPGQGFGGGGPGGRGGGPPGGGAPGGGGRGGPQAGCFDPSALAAGGTDSSNTAIFQAVQKLGLRLQPVKAPFDTIVVDKLEKAPTEN
jgi:uncharacterized protein (TIGR03435 family)